MLAESSLKGRRMVALRFCGYYIPLDHVNRGMRAATPIRNTIGYDRRPEEVAIDYVAAATNPARN